MKGEKQNLVIMFADLSGSTRLFETLGDTIALQKLTTYIGSLTDIIEDHQGSVIKTIGDEIMATFQDAGDAQEAACAIQESMSFENTAKKTEISVHIGFHYGPVILAKGDVFGDSVNVASRMVDLAKDGQIITTRETITKLSEKLQNSTRHLYNIPVKGRKENVDLFRSDLGTHGCHLYRRIPHDHFHAQRTNSPVNLSGQKQQGRQKQPINYPGTSVRLNDMVIDQPCISRKHAQIEYVSGQIHPFRLNPA